MKPGVGAGLCLADISNGLSKEEIQVRWKRGDYGKPGERLRAEFVAGYWRAMKGT